MIDQAYHDLQKVPEIFVVISFYGIHGLLNYLRYGKSCGEIGLSSAGPRAGWKIHQSNENKLLKVLDTV